jgi:hypothetical protein
MGCKGWNVKGAVDQSQQQKILQSSGRKEEYRKVGGVHPINVALHCAFFIIGQNKRDKKPEKR